MPILSDERDNILRTYKNSLLAILFLLVIALLVACGSNNSTTSSAPSSSTATAVVATPSPTTQNVDATATVEETNLMQQMKLVGTPTVKTTGTDYTVSGKIQNSDSKTHDIYVSATLLDASGKEVLTSTIFKVEDLDGGDTGSYTITGTGVPTNTKGLTARVSVVRVTFSA